MTLSELMAHTGADITAQDTVAGITCDSRKVQAGWVFVCICGTASDGHNYAAGALEAGAAAVVVQRDLGLPRQIVVESTRHAWAIMCANWFGWPSRQLRLIGITGTNGKTTVSYLLKSVLEYCGYKTGLVGTIQNMIGDRVLPSGHTTPDPYDLQSMFSLMAAEGCTYAVMEVSSHALDQGRVDGCHFDAGVFTNLTQDHLDYHGSMENYRKAKQKLFAMCDKGILNRDDPASAYMREEASCAFTTYSVGQDDADFTARNIRKRPDGVDFELVGIGEIDRVRLPIPGDFSVYNAMAAATCALAIGLPFEKVTAALSETAGVKGRAEIVPVERDYTVVIDYAHTPDGLENICRTMKECAAGRLVVLFGCGGDRDRTKRPKMGAVAASYADFCIVTSDNPRTEDPAAIIEDILAGMPADTPRVVVENRVEAIRWALEHAQSGDTILLAGKGHETYQVLKDGLIHLDEREVIAEALAKERIE